MKRKAFVIVLCIVLRFASVDLQRVEIGENVLKLTRKATFTEANEATNEKQDFISKDDHLISGSSDVISGSSDVISRSHDVISRSSDVIPGSSDVISGASEVISGSSDVINGSSDVISGSSDAILGSSDVSSDETEVSVKPWLVKARPKTLASRARNSGQRKEYVGEGGTDLWWLFKYLNRSISKKRSFPRSSAILNTGAKVEPKQTSVVRRRRAAEFSEEKKAWIARRNKNYARQQEHTQWGASLDYDVTGCTSGVLRQLIEATSRIEARLLDSLQNTNTASTDLVNEYKAARDKERKRIKIEYEDYKNNVKCWNSKYEIKDAYKTLLNDEQRGFINDMHNLRSSHNKFFETPSTSLEKYEQMKNDELSTYYPYIDNGATDIYAQPTPNQFEEGGAKEGGAKEGGAKEGAAKVPFECPPGKRASGPEPSRALRTTEAQVFIVFLCAAFGVFVVGLQGLEISGDDLGAKENVRKVSRIDPRMDRIGPADIRCEDRTSLARNRF